MRYSFILILIGVVLVGAGLALYARERTPVRTNQSANAEKWDQFALLLIDVQNDFWVEPMARQYPQFPEKVQELLQFCRTRGIEVIHIRSEFSPDKSDWPASYQVAFGRRMPCIRGTTGAEVVPFAAEQPGERVFIKNTFNAFLNPDVEAHLQKKGKKHLLLAGMTTETCVLSTAFGAFNRGYVVTLVQDCSAGMPNAEVIAQFYTGFIYDSVPVHRIPDQYESWSRTLSAL